MEHITNRSEHDQKCWLVFFLLRLVDTVNHNSVGPNGCNADKEWKWGYSNRSYCINDIIENRKAMVCWCVISWVILQCQISNHIWQFKAYPRERIGILNLNQCTRRLLWEFSLSNQMLSWRGFDDMDVRWTLKQRCVLARWLHSFNRVTLMLKNARRTLDGFWNNVMYW